MHQEAPKPIQSPHKSRSRRRRRREMVGFGLVFFLILSLVILYKQLIWKPLGVRSKLEKQGIRGPPTASFLLGNIPQIKSLLLLQVTQSSSSSNGDSMNHHWPSSVFPHLQTWTLHYGGIFMYSTGSIQFLCITDVEMVKQISLCTSLSLGKPTYLSKDRGPLLGHGILSSSGPFWAHQRKIIAPEFYIDKVKSMLNLMIGSTVSMLRTWDSRVESEGTLVTDMRVDEDLRTLSADIISRACFGSNYTQGEQIFLKLRQLQKVMSHGYIGIPGLRYVPTKNNRQIWKLQREIDSMILNVVKQRAKASYENDLLQMILEGANSSGGDKNDINMSRDKFIVDNCKNVYFAGHETTTITASWCLMLLAKYPEWQDRARAEVQGICKGAFPDSDMLRNMKVLTMVIQETLRLYPPSAFVIRETIQDMKFKDLQVPKGINIQIPIFALQHNADLWGPDAHEFNPGRFSNGVLGACKSAQAYMPFGTGSRTCLGQYFAMAELKVVLSLVLSRFCLSLSPSYKHNPAFRLVIQPGHGVQLCVRKL